MSEIAILEVFSDLGDVRRGQGKRHGLALCLALFTLAVAAGNRGFLAIGDWIDSYRSQLEQLFQVNRLPSYSTIRRVLLKLDYEDYSTRLARFLMITPKAGETLGVDGKVLRGSFMVESDNPDCDPHPAIMLVSAYLVERGLIG
ncbi:MAG: transposase family protein [Xenococcus sp. (in: cyanobacteria)]